MGEHDAAEANFGRVTRLGLPDEGAITGTRHVRCRGSGQAGLGLGSRGTGRAGLRIGSTALSVGADYRRRGCADSTALTGRSVTPTGRQGHGLCRVHFLRRGQCRLQRLACDCSQLVGSRGRRRGEWGARSRGGPSPRGPRRGLSSAGKLCRFRGAFGEDVAGHRGSPETKKAPGVGAFWQVRR
ncbi:hypothetical protein F8B43_3762 [Methylorubrum populi]|uniref:Uncharacterized protein n=1 Tax=Methylorubrum populi TaxID=223967 RepID=A0A833N2H5_9HYPH|nr:hypothetical protein F8B43_3762 [Methylorubrum populi]